MPNGLSGKSGTPNDPSGPRDHSDRRCADRRPYAGELRPGCRRSNGARLRLSGGRTISDIGFDRVEHDTDADVLYLHVGDPSRAVDYDETPEGHAARFDHDNELVGLTLVRPRRLLERDGELRVTVSAPIVVPPAALAAVLSA